MAADEMTVTTSLKMLAVVWLLQLFPLAFPFGVSLSRMSWPQSCLSRDGNIRRRIFLPLAASSTNPNGKNKNQNEDESWNVSEEENEEDPILESAIDSFLRGEYDRPFADDAPAPYPKLSPGATIETVLRSLRQLDEPEPSHGAAVLLRFCAPLSRAERWGGEGSDPWKEVLRGALTPAMLARRIRASQFSGLLDWEKLDVTEGMSLKQQSNAPTVAFVNAALFFGKGLEPSIIQFTLRRVAGVWLIDKARMSKRELFVDENDNADEDLQ